ncbi:MAG: nucleoside hydrolase, partial [Bacteroidetes bacterium]|nr:nucleoside hydrolase [Bacteroidota bacterium]
MRISTISFLLLIGLTAWIGCGENNQTEPETEPTSEIQETAKIPVIFDTDANNELDDQHALAYLLFNGETFDVKGITVNATRSGGGIDDQYAEAERVLKLCTLDGKIPLYHGADADFETIRENVGKTDFDGHKAVDFIISEAKKDHGQKLVLLPVGKLTNIALALEKAPEIKD